MAVYKGQLANPSKHPADSIYISRQHAADAYNVKGALGSLSDVSISFLSVPRVGRLGMASQG